MPEKLKVSCPQCGTTNNFPLEACGRVVCGRCRIELPIPGTVLEPGDSQFAVLVEKSSLPVLADFHSPTCPPCHMMHPIVEGLAERRRGELVVVKVDVDGHPQLAARYGIMAVPTFVVLHRGIERARTSGAMGDADFSLWVASVT